MAATSHSHVLGNISQSEQHGYMVALSEHMSCNILHQQTVHVQDTLQPVISYRPIQETIIPNYIPGVISSGHDLSNHKMPLTDNKSTKKKHKQDTEGVVLNGPTKPKKKKALPRKGLTNSDNDGQSPSTCMNLFLDDHLINLLVHGTNWYINNIPRNRKDKIAPVTPDEIRCVIAILYLSGYVDLPRVRMYWERAPDTSFPLVVDAIPRDRFEVIFTNLHAVGSPSVDKKNPLSKISTLVDNLREKFLHYTPSEEVHSVDELNVPYYKQATGLRQFTKTKTMKVWCGCTNSGYCVWFDHIEETAIESSSANPHMAVSKIFAYASKMAFLKLPNPCLVYDNVFTSVRIEDELKAMAIKAKPVPNRVSMTLNKSLQASKITTEKVTEISKVYNSPMGGIDKLDQNINLYAITIIGKKWTSQFLLAYVLDLAIQNAWQIYRHQKPQDSLDLLGFRRNIVTNYLTKYGKPTSFKGAGLQEKCMKRKNCFGQINARSFKKNNSMKCSDIRYDGMEHYVTPQSKQTRCFHCKMKTLTRCNKCDVGLHVRCFVDYHTYDSQCLVRSEKCSEIATSSIDS